MNAIKMALTSTTWIDTLDIGVGDVIVPKAEQRKINTQLSDFEEPVIKTYSIESTFFENNKRWYAWVFTCHFRNPDFPRACVWCDGEWRRMAKTVEF